MLDIIFIQEVETVTRPATLFISMMWDYSVSFSNVLMLLPFLFYSDFQDVVTTVAYYSPELNLGLRDFVSTY